MIQYSFNADKNRLDVLYTGVVTLKQILDYIASVENNKEFPRVLRIFTIARGIEMDFRPEDLHKVVKAVEDSVLNYEFIVDAFIVDKTKETAFSLLFSNISQKENYRFNAFSTEDAAENWLNSVY